MGNGKNLLLEYRIKEHYSKLTKAEKRVADYLLAHMSEIQPLSAQEIGTRSETGAATVVRFCRSCGFIGLSDLKASLLRAEIQVARSADICILPEDETSVIIQKVLSYHESVINDLKLQANTEALEAAANAILGAGRIIISGAGDSCAMAIILNNNLDMQGWETYFATDSIQELSYLSRLSPGDVMIGFSYTGRYRSTVRNLKAARKLGVTTIGVLGTRGSVAERYLDIALYTNAEHREYFFGSQNSLIGDYAIIEMLVTILAARRPVSQKHMERMRDLVELHRIQKDEEV